MTRTGKIARLPNHLRDQLNERLADGLEAKPILDWLNQLPEVREIIQTRFDNRPITEQNLSEWRQGGYRDWSLRQEIFEHARQTSSAAGDIKEETESFLVDDLATILTARYAALLAQWDGEVTEAFQAKLKVLSQMCQDVIRLQRSIHRAAEHNLKYTNALEEKKELEDKADKNQFVAAARAPVRIRQAAKLYGGSKEAYEQEELVYHIRHDLPHPKLHTSELGDPAQSHPIQPNKTKKSAPSTKAEPPDKAQAA